MIRTGMGMLIAAGLCAAAVAACSDSITPGAHAGTGGAAGSGTGGSGDTAGTSSDGGSSAGGSAGGGSDACTVACCPTDATCYSDATLKDKSPGAACLALRDNSGKDHIQMRQSWITATHPAGNTIPIVYGVLSGRTELPLNGMMGTANCNMGNGALGSGGYMQLIDYYLGGTDISKHYSVVGFAKFITPASVAGDIKNGFCMGTESYAGDTKYQLGADQMSSTMGWPDGLPAPMPLGGTTGKPWVVKPAKAKRLMADFNVSGSNQADRADLLKKLKPDGEYGMAGFNGVFFYDDKTGYSHGYSNLSYVIVYGMDATTHITIPIREAEPKATFNDPTKPNCVGVYGTDPSMTVAGGCKAPGDPKMGAAWGGGDCTKTTGNKVCKANEGPAYTSGYFMITELQQIFSSDLGITLCVSYPGQMVASADGPAPGFYDDTTKGCVTSNWKPQAAKNAGLPHGDWCAATNSAATADCHDAFMSTTFHTFSAAPIKLAADGTPDTCPF